MSHLIFSKETEVQFFRFKDQLPHALLIDGAAGSGTRSTALELADGMLAEIISPRDRDGNIDDNSGSIAITEIRALYDKTRGKSNQKRIFIIDDADKMTLPAQNAFLKLLEEPPLQTVFLLTSHSPHRLLQTVLSRVQRFHIADISEEQSKEIVHSMNVSEQAQALFIAQGKPAELSRLASQRDYFNAKSALFSEAREFLSCSPYKKMTRIAQFSERAKTLEFLMAVESILRKTISKNPEMNHIEALERYENARQKIRANGAIKLQLLRSVI